MGSYCCLNRKELVMESNNNTNIVTNNFITLLGEDYGTEAITEEYLKKMYSNANREENLEILLSLTDNKSVITINETLIRQNWLTKPETLGEVAMIQILNIIQKKVKGLLFDEKDYFITNTKDKYLLRIESIKIQFEKTDLINRMLTMLESQSSTKKDVAILILVTLSNVREFLNMMMKKEIIKCLIMHINQLKIQKYKNSKEHMIATLQLLRSVYVKDIHMRRAFLEVGGVQTINEVLKTEDLDLITEALYNIEDLIYNDDEEYTSISKLVIMEMVELLSKFNFEKTLYDLYKNTQKNRPKFSPLESDIKRLMSIFGGKEVLKGKSEFKQDGQYMEQDLLDAAATPVG